MNVTASSVSRLAYTLIAWLASVLIVWGWAVHIPRTNEYHWSNPIVLAITALMYNTLPRSIKNEVITMSRPPLFDAVFLSAVIAAIAYDGWNPDPYLGLGAIFMLIFFALSLWLWWGSKPIVLFGFSLFFSIFGVISSFTGRFIHELISYTSLH